VKEHFHETFRDRYRQRHHSLPRRRADPGRPRALRHRKELARLATNWPTDRLVQIWNGFAGVAGFAGDLKPVKKFTDRKSAVARIWKAIQGLDGAAPETATAAQEAATPRPRCPRARRRRPRRPKTAKAKDAAPEAREGSKEGPGDRPAPAQERCHLSGDRGQDGLEIVDGPRFMAGAMKKAGYTVESFKPEGGERTYRINS